ncbi:Nif3-like dinuclear metal center hexameric protein [Nocardia sp. alder85J]|uniref:Nif3-like dinuclear metal center hexameric protein n=1 Tax=Nocardia sp. alder85J TaxID=2862949 RepID=UPI001CD3148A|nr:Nif3-like dinuclear metal center hexameric protein [Nocardia sp. alder85J]MCX4098634.1 Nif3-like dinuclear metal center hexameric protein [Nocardia sp. alder85J]
MAQVDAGVTVRELVAALDAAYPPRLAESWDSVGLVCGDPADPVSRVLFAVDATAAVVDEAIAWGAQALVVHHPLLLRGVDTVAADTPKGALVHRLIRHGCALFTAHTNADSADPGVSDALAAALGVVVSGPLESKSAAAVDEWTVHVPAEAATAVTDALLAAGATAAGHDCARHGVVAGSPAGEPIRIVVVAPPAARRALLTALRSAHPATDPAFHVTERAALPTSCGLGRMGAIAKPETLRAFTARVRAALPGTVWGVRAAGDPDRLVHTVAVCGGAGDSFLGTVARLGVDAYVTADLRHHPVDEQLRAGGPALIDAAHWATEFPWCAQAATVVRTALPAVTTRISTLRTDPWTIGAADD